MEYNFWLPLKTRGNRWKAKICLIRSYADSLLILQNQYRNIQADHRQTSLFEQKFILAVKENVHTPKSYMFNLCSLLNLKFNMQTTP